MLIRFAENCGGATGGSSSEGSSYHYGASFEKMAKTRDCFSPPQGRAQGEAEFNLRATFKYIRTVSPTFDPSLESESEPISSAQRSLREVSIIGGGAEIG